MAVHINPHSTNCICAGGIHDLIIKLELICYRYVVTPTDTWWYRPVATSMVGLVSTGPLFAATTTFLQIFTNLVARPADWLAATRHSWPS